MSPFEFPLHDFRHLHAFAFVFDKRVARDRVAVDREQHVAALQDFPARTGLDHGVHEHAAIVILQAEIMPLSRVLEFGISNPEIDVAIVFPVLDVAEEAANHRRRNHVSDALRDVAAVALEGDADDFGILQNRAAAVPRIDLRADLDREMRVDRGMRVEIKIDPRNDACRNRHALAADGVAIRGDGRFERRNAAELERFHPFPEGGVGDLDDGQIAIVRHEKHGRGILIWIAFALDRQVAAVRDDVRVG